MKKYIVLVFALACWCTPSLLFAQSIIVQHSFTASLYGKGIVSSVEIYPDPINGFFSGFRIVYDRENIFYFSYQSPYSENQADWNLIENVPKTLLHGNVELVSQFNPNSDRESVVVIKKDLLPRCFVYNFHAKSWEENFIEISKP